MMKAIKLLRYFSAIALSAFAIVTLFMSSSVIFDWFDIRAMEGDYVPFIVWTNFALGFLYLISVFGFFRSKKWTFSILVVSEILLVLALIGLAIHIDQGRDYEIKTIQAMIFRITLTLFFAVSAYYTIHKQKQS